VELYVLVQERGIAAKSRLPQTPTEHHRGVCGRLIVLRAEPSPESGPHAECRKQAPGALRAARFLGKLSARTRQIILCPVLENRQVREALALPLPFGEDSCSVLVEGNSIV